MNIYLEKIQPLVKKYNEEALFDNDAIIRSFAFFGAQLQAFETGVKPEKLLQLFRRARLYQALTLVDQREPEVLSLFDLPTWQKLPTYLHQPGILANYHVGSYRLLSRWLLQQRIPFVLLVASAVSKKIGFQAYVRTLSGQGIPLPPVLLAEDPYVIRKMCRYIGEGYHILAYMDGGRGCQSTPDLDKLTPVPFFSSMLHIHRGIPMAARLTDCPIYPIIIPRAKNLLPKLKLHAPIYVDNSRNKQMDMDHALYDLFAFLQHTLSQEAHIYQWERWLFGQPIGKHRKNARWKMEDGNAYRYFPYRTARQCYMLSADSMMSYRISEDLYQDFVNMLKYLYI